MLHHNDGQMHFGEDVTIEKKLGRTYEQMEEPMPKKLTPERIEELTEGYMHTFMFNFELKKNKEGFTYKTLSERSGLAFSTVRAGLSKGTRKKLSFSAMVAVAAAIDVPLEVMLTPIHRGHHILEVRYYKDDVRLVYGYSTGVEYEALWLVKVNEKNIEEKSTPIIFETNNSSFKFRNVEFNSIEEQLSEYIRENKVAVLFGNIEFMDFSFDEYKNSPYWNIEVEKKYLSLLIESHKGKKKSPES